MSDQTTLDTTTIEADAPVDRRESLSQAFDNIETPEAKADRARDEVGRFAKQEQKQENKPIAPAPSPEPVTAQPAKLTTWKKDYIPLHEKLERGIPLDPEEARRLAAYNLQRESEYSTGISMHKDRASRLENLQKAIDPFMPLLQQHNIDPAVWMGNLGTAHRSLSMGTPQEKLQAFMKLAQDYQVPLNGLGQQQGADPNYLGLLEQINQLSGRIQTVDSWREQQEQQRVTQALSEFANAETYPHFEKVRGTMAQLLESGLAPDLKTAYAKAVHLDDELRESEFAKLTQAAQSTQVASQVVAQAKAKAVSPRSSTPSGQVSSKPPATDRRALISAELDAASGRV